MLLDLVGKLFEFVSKIFLIEDYLIIFLAELSKFLFEPKDFILDGT
jgi:hypothetical protein